MKLRTTQPKQSTTQQAIAAELAQCLDVSIDKLPINLSTKQAALIIGTSERCLHTNRHLKRDNIPYYKMGKRVLYPLWGIIQYKLDSLQNSPELNNDVNIGGSYDQ